MLQEPANAADDTRPTQDVFGLAVKGGFWILLLRLATILAVFAKLVVVGRLLGPAYIGLLGIAMLVLPGQGLLTVAIALALLDLPFKWRLTRAILSYRPAFAGINRLRARAQLPPLERPASPRKPDPEMTHDR